MSFCCWQVKSEISDFKRKKTYFKLNLTKNYFKLYLTYNFVN